MCKDLGNNLYECSGACTGTIWGSGIYTGDSNVYAAAKHMGLLPGKFHKNPAPGLAAYTASTLNGVTSIAYGGYATSFTVSKYTETTTTNTVCNHPLVDVEKLKAELQKLFEVQLAKYNQDVINTINQKKVLCTICGQKERSRVVFPCTHAHFCEECVKQVRSKAECPSCHSSVHGDMKIIL